ncbi:MAG: fibronectin type III domain-containing protein [Actinomycetota bacterium]
MRANLSLYRKLAATMMMVVVASGLSARADATDPVTKLLIPAPFQLFVTGTGPQQLTVSWLDNSSTTMAYELQWTNDPSTDSSWKPATTTPVTKASCSNDKFGQVPPLDTNNINNPINYYPGDPAGQKNSGHCVVILNSLLDSQGHTIEIPYADPANHVYWFRVRGITPYQLTLPAQHSPFTFPSATQGLLHSAWSGLNPGIVGPLPPTNVQLFPSFPSITVTWTNQAVGDPYFTGNVVERAQGSNIVPILTTASATTLLDGPLEYNQTYQYRVSAQRQFPVALPADPNTGDPGNPSYVASSFSASAPANQGLSITTPPTPAPSDPSNLIATFAAPSTANLQWMNNSTDEDGFLIEFTNGATQPQSDADWKQMTAIGPRNGTGFVTFSQFGIPTDTIRWYRVVSYRTTPYALSGPSNTAKIVSIPNAPTNLQVTNTTSFQTVLSFTNNSIVEDAFQFEACNPNAFGCSDAAAQGADGWVALPITAPRPAADGTGQSISYSDARFAGTTLKYRVRAFNTSGYSSPSNSVSSTTPAPPLNAPSNLTATASNSDPHMITLQFQDNTMTPPGPNPSSSDMAEHFHIDFQDPGRPFLPLVTVITDCSTLPANSTDPCISRSGSQVQFVDNTAIGETTRCYRVRAAIESENRFSDPSNQACARTVTGAIPAAPSGLVALPWSANPTMVVALRWNDNQGPGPADEDGTIIEQSSDAQNWTQVGQTVRDVTYDPNDPQRALFKIGNYAPNSVQYFRVKAFNRNGESSYSNVAQVVLLGPSRPVWKDPSKDNTIATKACFVDGSFATGFSPPITDIQITIVKKIGVEQGQYRCNSTPSSCTADPPSMFPVSEAPAHNQVQLNWNGAGTFKLLYNFVPNVTYELHARAVNSDGASADAFIPTFAVAAGC